MNNAVIVSCCRTAIGNFGGILKSHKAVDLGAAVLRDVLNRVQLRPITSPAMYQISPAPLRKMELIELEKQYQSWDQTYQPIAIDEVILGNVLQAGQGQNPARQTMIRAGYRKETPAFTINKVCGSGLKAIALGASSIMTGEAEIVVAGGQESMSNCPMALAKARWGHRMELSGKGEIDDLLVLDGLYEIFYGYHMGITAENIAELYAISRKDQDRLAVLSHNRARKAMEDGLFDQEITEIIAHSRKGESIIKRDERPLETNMETMSRLRPVFKKDGSVTAGNASGINDGAAAVLMMSEGKARELGLDILATIKAFSSNGLDPSYMGLGPVPAIRKVLQKTSMSIADIELIELNEAFASQAIACMLELGIDIEKPNQLGSGISLGHPIGCTGARQMVTALLQMQKNNLSTGLISMCIGGGMGMAMIIER